MLNLFLLSYVGFGRSCICHSIFVQCCRTFWLRTSFQLTKDRAKRPRKGKKATVSFREPHDNDHEEPAPVAVAPRTQTQSQTQALPQEQKTSSRPLPTLPPKPTTTALPSALTAPIITPSFEPGQTAASSDSPSLPSRSKEHSTASRPPIISSQSSGPTPTILTPPVRDTTAPEVAPSSSRPKESKVANIADRWADQAIIGVKPATKYPSPPSSGRSNGNGEVHGKYDVGAQALPGLATSSSGGSTAAGLGNQSERSPRSPRRHSRIPSTGNRATVMDVAQALSEQRAAEELTKAEPPKPLTPPATATVEDAPPPNLNPVEPQQRNVVGLGRPSDHVLHAPQMAKRQSSHEKYSAFMMPPLKEEKTPTPTPVGTMAVRDAKSVLEEFPADVKGEAGREVTGSQAETTPALVPLEAVVEPESEVSNFIEIRK